MEKKLKEIKKSIEEIDTQLLQKQALAKSTANKIRILTENKNKLKKKLHLFKDNDFISDHCVLRYLERTYSINFADIKKEILETKGLREAITIGVCKFQKDGKTFIINDGKVATIY